ncbi:penicillin-binding protein 1C [Rudaea sp.]|uniref:penicillin-binding protein 1C n=1 Tax=Rudaea sp. TaxID=2136325 RepID=UPI00378457DF
MIAFIKRWQNGLMAALLIALALVGIRLWPHAPLSQLAPSSTAVYDDHGRLLRLTLASDDRYRQWVPLAQMPPALVQGVMLHEDAWFRWHPGFNPLSLARGAWVTYVRGGNRQGGSTLTMQLARLAYRLNTRTPGGKSRQVLRAVELELCYSKDAILEAYLNYAPYGRNIEGAGAASLIYFDKPVFALTLPEALTLAVIPQDPSRRGKADNTSPSPPSGFSLGGEGVGEGAESQSADVLQEDRKAPLHPTLSPAKSCGGEGFACSDDLINTRLAAARARLFARWLAKHPEDKDAAPLMQLPLRLRAPASLPFLAPHFVEDTLADARLSGTSAPVLNTTLDLDLQRVLERQVKNHVEHNADRGVRNAVALLVDTRDLGIKALVGSADYFDGAISGQVNGALAKRSPGSALKPFIYGLGFDQGVLHPQTVLRDVPTAFGPFAPENFDGRFLGPVTATEALVRSRNIPAVYVASKLKNPDFYQFLKDAGISHMASEDFYGLALVLGGGEVTMEELARLYAMLANRGTLQPLRRRIDEPRAQGARVLSEEASFMVLDMLRQNPRPDDTLISQPGGLPVYWKTGTSWGFRDAWTAGVVGPYVLAVWVGNFDGSGNPAFVGVETAAPLFFHIVDALRARDAQMREPPRAMPKHLKRVEICLASGDLPNAWCPQRGMTWFIPGKSPIRLSTVHRPVVIDTATGQAACPPYDPAKTRTEVFEFWPSDLTKVFRQAGVPRRAPPAIPDCTAAADDGQAPQITSPVRGATYTRRASRDGEERVAFNATVDASTRELYWFVDADFIGTAKPGETLFWQPAAAGEYTLRAVDDRGRADSRRLRVDVVQ